jgi:hypothetical protein
MTSLNLLSKARFDHIRAILADQLHDQRQRVEALISLASLNPMPDALVSIINKLHDEADITESLVRDLDRAWERRNWTGADHESYALTVANID